MAAAGEDQAAALPVITDMESYIKLAKYPLVKMADMTADMREEAVDIIGLAVEKHVTDLEKCSQVCTSATASESEDTYLEVIDSSTKCSSDIYSKSRRRWKPNLAGPSTAYAASPSPSESRTRCGRTHSSYFTVF